MIFNSTLTQETLNCVYLPLVHHTTHLLMMIPSTSSNGSAPPPYVKANPKESSTPKASLPAGKARWDSIDDKKQYTRSPECAQAIAQLSRWLLEILAFTFEADMAALSSTSTQTVAGRATILPDPEKQSLLQIAHLLKDMCRKVGRSDWYIIPLSDRQHVIDSITKPCEVLNVDRDFVLALLASYATHQCDSASRSSTVLSKRVPYFFRYRSRFDPFLVRLGNTIRSHAKLVEGIELDEAARAVLQKAMAGYLERHRLTALPVSEDSFYWTDTNAYWEVDYKLKPFSDKFYGR
jgi:hypothetical protein